MKNLSDFVKELLDELKDEEKEQEKRRQTIIEAGCPHTNKVKRSSLVYKTEWLECDVCGKTFNLDGSEVKPILCSDCCYLGDKYSFEQPNELLDTDPCNPFLKHYYCNCGDCDNYRKDITFLGITECCCFEL